MTTKDDLKDFMLTGGEAIIGGAIKKAAREEQKRLTEALSTGNLFPHIEHEDRHALEKARHHEATGQAMIDRFRSRKATLGALLKPAPDADLPPEDLLRTK